MTRVVVDTPSGRRTFPDAAAFETWRCSTRPGPISVFLLTVLDGDLSSTAPVVAPSPAPTGAVVPA